MILARIEIPPVTGCGEFGPDRLIYDCNRIMPPKGHAGLARFQRQFKQGPAAGFAEIFHLRQIDLVHPAFQGDGMIGTFTVRFFHLEIIGSRRRGVHFSAQLQRTGIHPAGEVLNHRIHFQDRCVLSRLPFRKPGKFPEVLRFHEPAHQRTPGGKFADRHSRPCDVQQPVGSPFRIASHVKRAERDTQLDQPVILAVKDFRFPERPIRIGADHARFAVEHRVAEVACVDDELVKFIGLTRWSQKDLHRVGTPHCGRGFRFAEFVHPAFLAQNAQIQIVRVRSDFERGLHCRFGLPAGFEQFEVRLFRNVFPAGGVRIAAQRQWSIDDPDLCRKRQHSGEQSNCKLWFHILFSFR